MKARRNVQSLLAGDGRRVLGMGAGPKGAVTVCGDEREPEVVEGESSSVSVSYPIPPHPPSNPPCRTCKSGIKIPNAKLERAS